MSVSNDLKKKGALSMKKLSALLIAIIMCFALAACGENTGGNDNTGEDISLPPSSTTTGRGATSKASGTFDAEKIAENLVVDQYSHSTRWSTYVFHVIENTSEFTLEISGSLKTFDSAGNIIGAKSSSEEAVGAGQKTILRYNLDEDFDNSEYDISVSAEKYYKPVTQNLTYENSKATNKEIITVTNNGDIVAKFVEVNVLFFNGDTLADSGSRYFTDDDSEIKPGKSITEEISCREENDSIIVLFTGRG